jgi:chemotaxis protein CheD
VPNDAAAAPRDPAENAVNPPPRPVSLPMGEIAVARTGTLRTLLGSCLGVALYDRRLQLGALAHIVLPVSSGETAPPGKFADTAVPAMLEQLKSLTNGSRLRLEAKIAGGANMFATADVENSIGMQNTLAIERALETHRIPIAGRHCGGEQGRKMTFDLTSGAVTIDVVGAESVTI